MLEEWNQRRRDRSKLTRGDIDVINICCVHLNDVATEAGEGLWTLEGAVLTQWSVSTCDYLAVFAGGIKILNGP